MEIQDTTVSPERTLCLIGGKNHFIVGLPDEHQLRFSKYKTAQELWAAILKTFGGNEATKKTKKNQLKQQYGNFKAEEIEQDDLNQKFLTSLAPEWLMYTIVWRNRSDLDTMSLDDAYNHLKVYEPEVQKKSESNSQNMAFISLAKNSSVNGEVNTASIPTASTQVSPASANVAATSISLDTACAYIASQSSCSQIKYEDINQIDEDDIKEMDIKFPFKVLKWLALISQRWSALTATRWATLLGSARHPGAKIGVEEKTSNRIKYEDINQIDEDDIKEMDIKWNMALLSMRADRYWKKTGKKISIQGTEVAGFDKSKVECFNCHKMGHFARECKALRSQDRGRRENFKQGSKVEESALKALMAIDGVGWDWSYMANKEEDHALVADQEALTEFALMAKSSSDTKVFDNSLCSKACKKITDSLNTKIIELSEKLSATKTTLYHYKLGLSQVEARLVEFKNQEIKFCEKIRGLEFSVESKNNIIERLTNELDELKKEREGPSHSIESNYSDFQNSDSSVSKNGESSESIMSKPMIKFVKAADSPTVIKTNKDETVRKPSVKYAKMYRKTSKSSNVREKGKSRPKNNTHKSIPPRTVFYKSDRSPTRTTRPNMNAAQPKRTSFYKPAHSYNRRPFQRTSAVRTPFRVPRVSTINRKFPTVNRKFPTDNLKLSTADLRNKGKAGNSQNVIGDKGYWDSGCSRHMTGNISYLSD
nr:hypothetical protein [Tanacetum cinerariifolium]